MRGVGGEGVCECVGVCVCVCVRMEAFVCILTYARGRVYLTAD